VISRVIADDGAQPLRESLRRATVSELRCGPDERIVTHVFRIGTIGRVGERDRERRAVVASHERIERVGVAGKRAGNQVGVGAWIGGHQG
jgi:hypothetical protein